MVMAQINGVSKSDAGSAAPVDATRQRPTSSILGYILRSSGCNRQDSLKPGKKWASWPFCTCNRSVSTHCSALSWQMPRAARCASHYSHRLDTTTSLECSNKGRDHDLRPPCLTCLPRDMIVPAPLANIPAGMPGGPITPMTCLVQWQGSPQYAASPLSHVVHHAPVPGYVPTSGPSSAYS